MKYLIAVASIGLAALTGVPGAAMAAGAAAWPDPPVKRVGPWAGGGSADFSPTPAMVHIMMT